MVVMNQQIFPVSPMTPTVLVEYTRERQMRKSVEEVSITVPVSEKKAQKRHSRETVGESDGYGSPRRVDSEDSSAPKRKCISLNSDGFVGLKREIFYMNKLSAHERKHLRKRFQSELERIRDLQKNPAFVDPPVAINVAALSSSVVANVKKQGHHTSQLKRNPKGRFLPKVLRPAPSGGASDSMVKQCETVLKKLMSHKFSRFFNSPVDVVKYNIPDYFDIIKHPMDLGTIKKKITSGSYNSPWGFAADVRLTFTNAMTYNPPGHDIHHMADTMSKIFEAKWKPIEKKLSAGDACIKNEVEVGRLDLQVKKRKSPPVDHSDVLTECIKPRMTLEERDSLGNCLASIQDELPVNIIEFLRQCCSNSDQNGDDELEIDMHSLSDDMLFELKKMVDNYMLEKKQKGQQAKSEPSENEVVNVSGLSHSSAHPCKGGEPVEEDVDICGNDSPILIEKDVQARSIKRSSSSSSSSDSGSSSSDSDSDSSSESESHERAISPAKSLKANGRSELPLDQEKSDVISSLDANRPSNDLELQEQDSQSKPASEGENAKPERQVSPDKLYRAALLRGRFADTIFKAREKMRNQNGEDPEKLQHKREELERQQREEKARLLAEAKAAEEARRAEAEAEAKRKRELEREAARQALQEMEKTVEINDGLILKDLEMLRTAPAEHIVSSVDETSPDHSPDGMACFMPGTSNPLEQLGLFMKVDDDEEEEDEPSSVPVAKDTEEGEID